MQLPKFLQWLHEQEEKPVHKCTITVESRDKQSFNAFIELCAMIQHLGSIGASRSIDVFVDGDGAARLKFTKDGEQLEIEEYKELESKNDNHEGMHLGIGV